MIKNLSDKLKTLRRRYGYSQKQVADKLGVSPSVVSGYETGERTPSVEVLLSLAYLYNCSVDYLLGKQNEKSAVVIDTETLTDEQIKAIIALVDSIKKKNDI